MLETSKLKTVNELVSVLNHDELIWLNGFISAQINRQLMQANSNEPDLPDQLFVLYGTETGNSKSLALEFSKTLKSNSKQVRVKPLDQISIAECRREKVLVFFISTHGEGDPPDQAKSFFQALEKERPDLKGISFTVFALGDSSYPHFCKAGYDLHQMLTNLGARPLREVQTADVDYQETFQLWSNSFFSSVKRNIADDSVTVKSAEPQEQKKAGSGKQVFNGKVLLNTLLNDAGSGRETHFLAFETDQPVDYRCGDSVGIYPHNSDETVGQIIQRLSVKPDTQIEFKGNTGLAVEQLKEKLNVSFLTARQIKRIAGILSLNDPDQIPRMDLLQLINSSDAQISSEQGLEILQGLDAIQPRLYTIASSPSAHPGEIHITAGVYKLQHREGLGSGFLKQMKPGQVTGLFLQRNKRFFLPADEKDLIMIGPGTGIAPFRAFLAEREYRNASGRNWLFFGEQQFVSDFYFQTEIQDWFLSGLLTSVNLAFSRDQQERIYVQHKMKEQASELWNWISNGAVVSLSGLKDPAGRLIEQTLVEIISEEGSMESEAARAYLDNMSNDSRYQKELY